MRNQIATISSVIRTIRGQKVLLDEDLARIYGVPTKALNRAVKRNLKRFPDDFMFQLTRQEFGNSIPQPKVGVRAGRQGTTFL